MVNIPDVVYNSNLKKHLMNNPIYASKITSFKIRDVYKDELFTNSPPAVFVGSKLERPFVNVGILSPHEKKDDVWLYDAQRYWAENNFDINRIIEFRNSLVNSRFQTRIDIVRDKNSAIDNTGNGNTGDNIGKRFIELAREIGMSKNPVDTEIKLKKKIKLRMYFDDTSLPIGARGNLSRLSIGNTKIPRHVDKVYYDTDLKAVDAVEYLNKHGYDEQKLSQLLSIGIFGQDKKRVLVPTRWSITAVDSMLGNELCKKVKSYEVINEYRFFYGHYFGNHYFVLFFPEMYNYELFETYLPGSFWNPTQKVNIAVDFEPFKGRTKYADNTAGGFYATRLGVLEYLNRIKRQAAVLIFRIETPDYWLGLGVFVVREAIRKTMRNNFVLLEEKDKAINLFKSKILEKFNLDITEVLMRSKLIDAMRQKKIVDFVN